MSRYATHLGNLSTSGLRDLTDAIQIRAISARAKGVAVYSDDKRDVFAVRGDIQPDFPDSQLVGFYTRTIRGQQIAEDLIFLRDGK